jgi:hypothetical protein
MKPKQIGEVNMRTLLLAVFILALSLSGQERETPPPSPIVVYWKTLTPGEKEIFLFSYLTQVYDTYEGLKRELGYGKLTTWYFDHRADMVFGIFDQLEKTELTEFVKWIDEYYRHEEFMDRPFYEALEFAFRFQQAAGETIWEKYQNLNFDQIELNPPPEE